MEGVRALSLWLAGVWSIVPWTRVATKLAVIAVKIKASNSIYEAKKVHHFLFFCSLLIK